MFLLESWYLECMPDEYARIGIFRACGLCGNDGDGGKDRGKSGPGANIWIYGDLFRRPISVAGGLYLYRAYLSALCQDL